jgi:hypothetical protein
MFALSVLAQSLQLQADDLAYAMFGFLPFHCQFV